MTPEERNAELEAENAALREQVRALLARVQELEARLAKDSHNSGKPPSSDGLKRKTKSLRTKSGKKPGGQLGHRGETLRLVAAPDAVVEHRPSHCPQCQTPLADAEVVLRERRQVHELPPGVRLQITEHQALHVRCPTLRAGQCRRVSRRGAEPGAVWRTGAGAGGLSGGAAASALGRVQQLLSDLWRLRLGRGTLVRWIQQAARVLEPVERHIKAALTQRAGAAHDETGVRRAGALAWAHVTSTSRLTHYAIHPKRGREAPAPLASCPTSTG